jgi:serine/threonine protein phosphatase 1
MSLAIVGDIHGDVQRLRRALRTLIGAIDEFIFVGDYIDRGPQSREVIDELITLKRQTPGNVTVLRGNHEVALLDYLDNGSKSSFIAHGGLATVKSYLGPDISTSRPLELFRATFPAAHLEFLWEMDIYVERRDMLVSHCGFNPAFPERRQIQDMTSGRFPALFTSSIAPPKELIVFGHYVQFSQLPYTTQNLICLDTGCGTIAGPLTVVILPDRRFLQF